MPAIALRLLLAVVVLAVLVAALAVYGLQPGEPESSTPMPQVAPAQR